MPSILNLKFKGNKSFVPFSNLGDADALTKTWKVCTKVASFLEQGQRLENLSWRLWHLQNLMVDTDDAKSKRDFKKLSKCMGDKLDKEKGRSIEELRAPGYRRNHSTELIQQRAAEKEREREANLNGRPGTIHRMQFTFSVDQPSLTTVSSAPVKKPDLKPSPEFRDNALKRGRPATRAAGYENSNDTNDKGAPLTQRDRKPSVSTNGSPSAGDSSSNNDANHNDLYSLRFPSLFSSDFGPTALLYPTPTVTNGMTYGEGVGMNTHSSFDGFSIPRPTIELPLDDILNADSPSSWSPYNSTLPDHQIESQEDVEMKSTEENSARSQSQDEDDVLLSTSALRNVSPLSNEADLVPRTITPSRINPGSSTGSGTKKPALSVRTQSVSTRSSGPSATPVNASTQSNTSTNSAPGGVKAECSNCGATHTPLWRRGLNDELNCNACGLYCKLHKRPRPKSMRNSHGEGRAPVAPRQESQEVIAQCYNCHTTATPLWRKDDEGKTVCNACGLYYKLHGSARPISMKSDVIRKRARHDARRVGASVSETPSASPGASRRASPTVEPTPTLAPDSTTQMSSNDTAEYKTSMQSELMGALGGANGQHGLGDQTGYTFSYNAYPGPYHPDYLSQLGNFQSDPLPFASADISDAESGTDSRVSKRRRMSNDSASEPPSSAVSFSSLTDSYTSASSSTSQSQRSSVDYNYKSFSIHGMLRGSGSTPWHPPMLLPDGSPQLIHPPMLPPDDSPHMFMHPPMVADEAADALFATYLHPPMLPPEDSPHMSTLQLHPPMLPSDWKDWKAASHDYYDTNAIAF